MSVHDIIRAWKDKEFRAGLSEAQRALLPENPAGVIELSAAALEQVWGGSVACAGSSYSNGMGSFCSTDRSYCGNGYTKNKGGC